MFSNSSREFMAKNMEIIVDSIESKINEPIFSEIKAVAVAAIENYIVAIQNFENSGKPRVSNFFSGNEAEKFIRKHFLQITEEISDDSPIYHVLDSLRYCFSGYAYGGLHQIYTRQQNEGWHPKIILTKVLEPNDIESLPLNLTIYRGCDISELEKNSFGQAWSTSLDAAKEFAYHHYSNQDWFDEKKRIVLVASYTRDNVLFSVQSSEYEVVVNVEKLQDVRKY